MKLAHPVDIRFRDFVLYGTFDYVKVGQTKEWLQLNFPDPDSKNDMGNDLSIWLYGNVEFHFDGDLLYLIWCDYLDTIDLGDAFRFDKWILGNDTSQGMSAVLDMLINEGVDFRVIHQFPHTVLLHIDQSEVTLWFEGDEEDPSDRNAYGLHAFSLSHPDYDNRFKD